MDGGGGGWMGVGGGSMGDCGGWMGVGGGWGVPPTHAQARTHMHGKHDNFMQMATPIGGIPGNSL